MVDSTGRRNTLTSEVFKDGDGKPFVKITSSASSRESA
jgi:hypothetical protein